MAESSSTTIKVKKTTLKRLAELKPHSRCTHSDVIDILLDANDKKKVKPNDSL